MNASERDEALDAAGREIARNGYAATSLSAVAAQLGLTKGALVRKFPTKEQFAWNLMAVFRKTIEEERAESLLVYPESGIRAMLRFFLSIGNSVNANPQIRGAVVLITDRTSPVFEVADILVDWIHALESFLQVAQAQNELDSDEDPRSLAEYIFITNMGEAMFSSRMYRPVEAKPLLHHVRRTLANVGLQDADAVVDEVIATRAEGSLMTLPAIRGIVNPNGG